MVMMVVMCGSVCLIYKSVNWVKVMYVKFL